MGVKNLEFLYWFLMLLGIFSIVYYVIIVLYAGSKVNFSRIWCLGGIGCIGIGILIRYLIHVRFPVPEWLIRLVYILGGITLVVFILLEAVLLFNAHNKARRGMDYLLVLGAQINENKVTKNLKIRLDTAIAYLVENPDTLVVVTGGRGRENLLSEAAAMKAYLLEQGIDQYRILTEDQSTNTTENMKFSKKLMRENATVAIVTNGFHIYRSTRLAKKQGMKKVFSLVAPTDRIMCLHYYIREAAGILKDWLLGNL
jgi:uncharacterized SAM-binding protein YcdF (DUF218 family)